MSHIVLYVLGPPGVGKTTLIRELVPALKPDSGHTRTEVASPKWTLVPPFALAGHWRGTTFDGGDTVPYTGARAALEYWHEQIRPMYPVGVTILDGDRFSTQPSLDYLRTCGVDVFGVHLVADEQFLAARRAHRGSNQNEAWMRGRATKAANFAKKIGAIPINANEGVAVVARIVTAVVTDRQRELAA